MQRLLSTLRTWAILVFCLLAYSFAQSVQGEALLTTSIYDDKFDAKRGAPERAVAAGLKGQSLSDLVQADVIRRDDMRGFALPLGVHNNHNEVDFMAGMLAMWDDKALRAMRREQPLDAAIMHQALLILARIRDASDQTTLRAYREDVIAPAVEAVRRIHRAARLDDDAQQQFLDLVIDNLSPNVMLGFNLQEMLPPRVGNANRWVNAYFKAYYFDRLLQEAGGTFVVGFPARYDALLSFGPFQMTDVALRELQRQAEISRELGRFEGMRDLQTLEDHALAAAMFAYVNWRALARFLHRYGGLARVNAYFKDASRDAQKRRTLRILIAGTTACMHHQPNAAHNIFQDYAKTHRDLSDMHHAMFDAATEKQLFTEHPERLPQLQKYYRSAAEAYLILKVYHLLEED